MNRYEMNLLNAATKLDAVLELPGEFVGYVEKIIGIQAGTTDLDETDIIKQLIRRLSECVDYNYQQERKELVKQIVSRLRNSLYIYVGYTSICRDSKKVDIDAYDSKSLEDILEELNMLIGLHNVKHKVEELIAFQKVQLLRRKNGLKNTNYTKHMAFTGNPGTGKTTVARIVGHLYKKIGALSKGHFIEVSRTDLIAGYQGQTAMKVKSVIEKAKGGVLFIDEAYSITENDHADSYGRECLTELTKALEDYREDLVVIVAGYTEPMKQFFESNPGLKSRFNTFIEFDDYSPDELVNILNHMCEENNYYLSYDLNKELLNYFTMVKNNHIENFANGRLARNMFDNLIVEHAKRVVKVEHPTKEDLSMILIDDYYRIDLKG